MHATDKRRNQHVKAVVVYTLRPPPSRGRFSRLGTCWCLLGNRNVTGREPSNARGAAEVSENFLTS